jgi:hypothetical protein
VRHGVVKKAVQQTLNGVNDKLDRLVRESDRDPSLGLNEGLRDAADRLRSFQR